MPRFHEFKQPDGNKAMINIEYITFFRKSASSEEDELDVWLTNGIVKVSMPYNLMVGICTRDPKTAG